MGKITDMIVSALLKKGILYEARNCDVEFDVPTIQENAKGEPQESKIKIHFKAEHMTLKIEKE
jgi:cysteinyl-tRNA synthetase